jgi:hypothetical protein
MGVATLFAIGLTLVPVEAQDQSDDEFTEDAVDLCKELFKTVEKALQKRDEALEASLSQARYSAKGEVARAEEMRKTAAKLWEDYLEQMKDGRAAYSKLETETKTAKGAIKEIAIFIGYALRYAEYAGAQSPWFDYNIRWARFYARNATTLINNARKSLKLKKRVFFECDRCSDGLAECPACQGSGKCKAQVLGDEKCKNGIFDASHDRLCPVCNGSTVCNFCEGTGRVLCSLCRRTLKK